MYNFRLNIKFDLKKRTFNYVSNEHQFILNEEEPPNNEQANSFYRLTVTNDFIDNDYETSEIIRFNKALRTITDLVGHCGTVFYIIAVGDKVVCYYQSDAHQLLLKILSNYHNIIV